MNHEDLEIPTSTQQRQQKPSLLACRRFAFALRVPNALDPTMSSTQWPTRWVMRTCPLRSSPREHACIALKWKSGYGKFLHRVADIGDEGRRRRSATGPVNIPSKSSCSGT